MANWQLLEWIGAVAGLAAVIAAVYAALQYHRRTKPETDTKVTVTASPGATAAGRNIGGTGGHSSLKAEVEVTDSAKAKVAGGDVLER